MFAALLAWAVHDASHDSERHRFHPFTRRFHSGIRSRMYSCVRSASCWNVLLVVRPQPGQAVTLGENERRPRAWSSSHAA